MKIGYRPPLYRSAQLELPVRQVQLAESLGYHSVWTGEAYGVDALSPLAYLAAVTRRIKLATSVVQLAARTPAATAMHAMTIDALAGGGRVILGIGLSGPQIVEGWYGQPWGSPARRLRDYVEIVRRVLRREEGLAYEGAELSLPYRGPGALGQGKALRSIMHPNPDIPIWLASGGPTVTALAAEVGDGWLPMGYGPGGAEVYGPSLARGFARRPSGRAPDTWEAFTAVEVRITDDVRGAIESLKPLTGMYVGGMGSATHNFHRQKMERGGFADEAARVHELWLAGRKQEAILAVPDAYIEQGALLGSPARIRGRWEELVARPGLTGVILTGDSTDEAITLVADLAGSRER